MIVIRNERTSPASLTSRVSELTGTAEALGDSAGPSPRHWKEQR